MNSAFWKKAIPHIAAIGIFLLVAVIYCKPVLQGKALYQHDNLGWKGMAQQSFEFKEKYGHFPLWTNSMFSGMPAYQIALSATNNINFNYISHVIELGLPKPINFFFLACLSFYILGLVVRLNPWIAVLSALAYAYSTYDPIIVAVGHDTKMLAIGYAPFIIAGLILLYEKRYWWGVPLMAIGLSIQLGTSHLQIVYYTMLIAGALTLGYLIESIKTRKIGSFVKSTAIAAILAVICLGVNALNLLLTNEYAKETMRGKTSELKNANDRNVTKGGLDKDYAFQWSYGIGETFTLINPSYAGGGTGPHQHTTSDFADRLMEAGYPDDAAIRMANGSGYFGEQPTTYGPVYLGAVVCFLVILGMFTLRGWFKWWLIGISAFAIILAWGKNLESVNYFLFDYLPMYKKFRVPTVGLFIPQFCFALLAGLSAQQFLFGETDRAVLWKKLKQGGLVTGAVLVVLLLIYFSSNFTGSSDARLRENFSNAMLQQLSRGAKPTPQMQQQAAEFGRSFTKALQADRKSWYIGDWARSLLFIGLSFLALFAFVRGKIKRNVAIIALVLLSSLDLLLVGRRYLNDDDFVEPAALEENFAMTPADVMIKKDTAYFRVFNETQDPYNESQTSYYHNSIGGYSPAKLSIYQDIMENQLAKGNMNVFDMLNTKYFIVNNEQLGRPVAQVNPGAYGPAWFVKSIKYVRNAKEEMAALDSTNLRDTAIIQEAFRNGVKAPPQYDSTATIQLVANKNDTVIYRTSAPTPQFAVLSEVYYDKGWNAYLDGQKTDYVKVNYVLRGISVPAGQHTIEFRFEPSAYRLGNTLVMISSIVLLLIVIVCIYMIWKEETRVKPMA